MLGQLSTETELKAPAAEAWQLYGTLELARLVENQLSHIIQKVETVEGDGREGTLLNLIFAPGFGLVSYKEKYTKVDDEKRVKEAEVVEGGYLDIGFTLYRVRFEIIEKDQDSCIVKSTIEYEAKDQETAKIVTIQPLIEIAQAANKYLVNQPAN